MTHEERVQQQSQIVGELTNKLKEDPNVLAVALCPKTSPTKDKGQLDFLVIVSRMPFDLDLFGRKRLEIRGVPITLTYYREERLKTAIEEEAGCWLVSGKVLYSESLHDPNKLLLKMRKAVNAVTSRAKMDALSSWLNQARAFPALVYSQKRPDSTPEESVLGEQAAIARSLFLLNGKPPQDQSSLLTEMMELPRLPQGIKGLFDIANSFDKQKPKKFRRAEKDYIALIAEIEDLARNSM